MLIKETRRPRNPLHHDPTAVRQARLARDMSQADLAKAVGLRSGGHMSEIEGGTRNAGPELLATIAKVLGCAVTALERKKKHTCTACTYGYDDAPNALTPLHTVPGTADWCPAGGQPLRSAA